MDPGWIATITALAVALAAAASWAARQSWRILMRTRDFLDDWAGHPPRPGVDAAPGVMERLQRVEKITTEIRAETQPNGGVSMRDVLHRTAAGVSDVKDDVAKLAGRVELFEHQREDRDS